MLVLAHRGASRIAPENTPEAFVTADRQGADGVELDVRLAVTPQRGRRLVVHHDPLPTGPDAAEVIDGLPGFDEVLDACGDRLLVNVEIKNSASDGGFDPTMAVVGPTLDALRRRGRAQRDRWLISSFSLETVDHFRALAPDVLTAQLVGRADDELLRAVAARGHAAIHPWEQTLTADQVAVAHDLGLLVNTWTCNDPDRLVELASIGVDGVCTDAPDLALVALDRDPAPAVTPRWGTRGGPRPARG